MGVDRKIETPALTGVVLTYLLRSCAHLNLAQLRRVYIFTSSCPSGNLRADIHPRAYARGVLSVNIIKPVTQALPSTFKEGFLIIFGRGSTS